eukprot:1138747-Pelagomonas_calceolata.AAC.1
MQKPKKHVRTSLPKYYMLPSSDGLGRAGQKTLRLGGPWHARQPGVKIILTLIIGPYHINKNIFGFKSLLLCPWFPEMAKISV